MQKFSIIMLTGTATVLLALGSFLTAPVALADEDDLTPAICKDKDNPPKDAVTQGFCLVIDRRKGNCMGCHLIKGVESGNIAPPMVSMKQRFPEKAKLREQIHDATKINPDSVMPPFGKHGILSADEVDKITEYVWTL
jgi:L-cysteine S-thiosulfotransferase